MAEAGEARAQRAADAGKRGRAHPGHGVRHLDHHAVRLLEPIDEVRLERAAPGEDLLTEEARDRDRRVQAEVPAERGVTDAAPAQHPRGVDRPRGDDHYRRADLEPSLHGFRLGGE